MPEYEWRRLIQTREADPANNDPGAFEYEYKTSKTTRQPKDTDGKGEWSRVYSFGVGSVPGAGGSPARTVRRQDGSS